MSITAVIEGRVVTGYHQLASGDLTTATTCPGTGSVVMIQAEAQNIRYRLDGVNPTTTEGTLLAAGECHTLAIGNGNINKIKVIEAAVGGILNVHAFR
jgi:hypothetical protein